MIRLSGEQTDGIKLEYGKAKYVDCVPKKSYNPEVISGIVDCCVNKQVDITGLTSGVIAKLPVVLAQFTVQLNIHSSINLPDYIKEVKDIKKKIKVTQCCLLQDTNMLFIKGTIRKEIDYTSNTSKDSSIECGDVQHCTVDIPFKCTTPVTFNGIEPEAVVASNVKEFEFFKKNSLIRKDVNEEDEMYCDGFTEKSRVSNEYYNEVPYCELVSSKMVEHDECIKPCDKNNLLGDKKKSEYKILEEKGVLYLTLKILQDRQVAIPPSTIICDNEKS